MPELDRKALKEAALKATPGPRVLYDDNEGAGHPHRPFWNVANDAYLNEDDAEDRAFNAAVHYGTKEDAAFIALANPATILSLLASLEEAETELERYRTSYDDLLRELSLTRSAKGAAEQRERRLREVVAGCCDALKIEARANEMSANLMRDPARTGGWRGAENVARSYDRHGLKVAGIRATLLAALSEEA